MTLLKLIEMGKKLAKRAQKETSKKKDEEKTGRKRKEEERRPIETKEGSFSDTQHDKMENKN